MNAKDNITKLSNNELVVFYGNECRFEGEKSGQNLPVVTNRVIADMEAELISRLNRADTLVCMTPGEYAQFQTQQNELLAQLREIETVVAEISLNTGITPREMFDR